MVFNSEAQVFTPLTFDHANLKNNIASLKNTLLPQGSTDFNAIFDLIIEKFGLNSKKESQSKVCIIITDGENFQNIDNQNFKLIKKNNIDLFIIGVGSQMGSKIPTLNGYKKDKNGQDVVSILDINQINDIAKQTGGQYFIVNNQRNQVADLIEKLSQIKSSSNTINQQMVTYNKYIYFLLIAFIFIILDFLLTVNVLKL
jgi:Ca-activated chloride channel family protein